MDARPGTQKKPNRPKLITTHTPLLTTSTTAERFHDASLPEVLRSILEWAWFCKKNPGCKKEWELRLDLEHPGFPAQLRVFIQNVKLGTIELWDTILILEYVFLDGLFGPEGEKGLSVMVWVLMKKAMGHQSVNTFKCPTEIFWHLCSPSWMCCNRWWSGSADSWHYGWSQKCHAIKVTINTMINI